MRRRPSLTALIFAVILCAFAPLTSASAQDTPPAANGGVDAEDPTDRIVAHIKNMTELVKSHKADPDKLLKEFEIYIGQNRDAMRKANKDFEARLKVLSADESKKYQEALQRKLEKPMQDFLTAMLDFEKAHPDKAKALDERLYKITQE